MKYISEYRDSEKIKVLAKSIFDEVDFKREYRFMEFCGGHTHTIFRYGIPDIIPKNIKFIHGPGCPVCVLPIARIEMALKIAQIPNVILCSYGDMLRVPGLNGNSLLKVKATGHDVRMVYSCMDALQIAQQNPEKQVVFLAIGFETTSPTTAATLKKAKKLNIKNFYVFCNHMVSTPAVVFICDSKEVKEMGSVRIDGFVGPAHVSAIIGPATYEPFVSKYKKPVVVTGFEPMDILQSVFLLVRQINSGNYQVINQYKRGIKWEGNLKAQSEIKEVFEIKDIFLWRGMGEIPNSGLKIRSEYQQFDAEVKLNIKEEKIKDKSGCICGEILRGIKEPFQCKLFGKVCNPEKPVGSCMVSSEGTCAAYYSYKNEE